MILSMVWPPNSPWAPWWRTNRKTAREICKLAGISKDDIVYDLGCGDGTFIITAAKEFEAKAVGIEIDRLRFFVSTLLLRCNRVVDMVTIKRKSFFDEDLSKATVVFVYLVPKTLDLLLPKFKKELKKGTRIVSYKYEMKLKKSSYAKALEDKQKAPLRQACLPARQGFEGRAKVKNNLHLYII